MVDCEHRYKFLEKGKQKDANYWFFYCMRCLEIGRVSRDDYVYE